MGAPPCARPAGFPPAISCGANAITFLWIIIYQQHPRIRRQQHVYEAHRLDVDQLRRAGKVPSGPFSLTNIKGAQDNFQAVGRSTTRCENLQNFRLLRHRHAPHPTPTSTLGSLGSLAKNSLRNGRTPGLPYLDLTGSYCWYVNVSLASSSTRSLPFFTTVVVASATAAAVSRGEINARDPPARLWRWWWWWWWCV